MKYFLFLLCSIFSLGLLAQEAAPAAETATAINSLPEWEDSLVRQFNTIASEFSGAKRQEMAKTFVPSLVKALKTPNSANWRIFRSNILLTAVLESSHGRYPAMIKLQRTALDCHQMPYKKRLAIPITVLYK